MKLEPEKITKLSDLLAQGGESRQGEPLEVYLLIEGDNGHLFFPEGENEVVYWRTYPASYFTGVK